MPALLSVVFQERLVNSQDEASSRYTEPAQHFAWSQQSEERLGSSRKVTSLPYESRFCSVMEDTRAEDHFEQSPSDDCLVHSIDASIPGQKVPR